MRTLPLPSQPAAGVLATCIGGVRDQHLAARLRLAEPQLVAAAAGYDQLARAQGLHLVGQVQGVAGVGSAELQALYAGQMGATRGAARRVYDAIRNAPPNGKCPLCGVGTVSGLDHHLPKSRYPDLSVCPSNLVPACDPCNRAKLASFPATAGEQTIHPYFDDFTQEQWIFARLDAAVTPVLVFRVDAPAHWPEVRRERARRHFDVVGLGRTYTSNANDDLMTLRGHLATVAASKGAPGVAAYLADERARHSARLNSWQHATYQTLASDARFVGGGYLAIPA